MYNILHTIHQSEFQTYLADKGRFTQKNTKKLKKKKLGQEEKEKKNGVILIIVSNLHATGKGRRLEEYSLKQLSKTKNRKNTSVQITERADDKMINP